MRQFVGGQQKLMPELLAMVAPTVNSYRRLIPGFWAPTDATWGIENRTMCAARDSRQCEIAARRVPHRRGGCEPVHHPGRGAWHRDCAASRRRSSRQADREGNAYDAEIPGAPGVAARHSGTPRSGSKARRWRVTGSATHSSSTIAATREWEEREFRKHITRLGTRALFRDHLRRRGRSRIGTARVPLSSWTCNAPFLPSTAAYTSSDRSRLHDESTRAGGRADAQRAWRAGLRAPSERGSAGAFLRAFESQRDAIAQGASLADGPADRVTRRTRCAARSSAPAT